MRPCDTTINRIRGWMGGSGGLRVIARVSAALHGARARGRGSWGLLGWFLWCSEGGGCLVVTGRCRAEPGSARWASRGAVGWGYKGTAGGF